MPQTKLIEPETYEPDAIIDAKATGFYDIETFRGFSSDIACIGFKEHGKDFQVFEDSTEFVDFLKGHYKSIKLFGYNSGKFDALVLLENLRRKEYPVNISNVVFSGSSINALQMDNILFKDLILCFGVRFRLNQLARDFFGESKKDYDASNITEVTPELIEYNKKDVELTERIYDELVKIMQVKISTAASMSMNTFIENFRPDIKKLCDRRGITDSYKGGRVEIFKFIGEDIDVYDVNSMYPYVMKEFPYPVGPVHHGGSLNKEGYAFAIVDTPYSYIPYLASKTEKKLLFPYGRIYGYFTNFELRKAKEYGSEVRILDIWTCDETEYLFAPYIKHFYDARLEAKRKGEVSKDIMYKTLMNCLYGKFGQRIMKDKIFSMDEDEYYFRTKKAHSGKDDAKLLDAEVIFKYKTREGNKLLLRIVEKAEHIYHDYIIASYVTGYARNRLYDFFLKAGLESMYYCDTDSIFTSSDLSNECGDELGLIKKEKTYTEYAALMPKLYRGVRENGKVDIKAKGFRRIDPRVFEPVEIAGARIWDFRKNYIERYVQPAGFREASRRNDSFFHVVERTKHIVSEYDKRVKVDEVETKPLNMTMETIA